jgi:hypothetical protein
MGVRVLDRQTAKVTDELLLRAWLYPDPGSFREGVMAAARALGDRRTDPKRSGLSPNIPDRKAHA